MKFATQKQLKQDSLGTSLQKNASKSDAKKVALFTSLECEEVQGRAQYYAFIFLPFHFPKLCFIMYSLLASSCCSG